MATGVGFDSIRWKALRAFSITWLVLTLISFTAVLRHSTELGLIGSIVAVSLAGLAIMRSEWRLGLASLATTGLIFFLMIADQLTSGAAKSNLPLLLLQFVMLLFTVEVLTSVVRQQTVLRSSAAKPAQVPPEATHARTVEDVQTGIARVGVFFATCYLVTVGVLYVGSILRSISPIFTDVSLYMVVVSISLGLLILLREE